MALFTCPACGDPKGNAEHVCPTLVATDMLRELEEWMSRTEATNLSRLAEAERRINHA